MAGKKTKRNRAYFNQLLAGIAMGISACGMTFAMNFPTFGVPSMEKDDSFSTSPDDLRLIGSIVPAGAMVGNFLAGMLVDNIGRKMTMMAGAVLCLIAYVLLACAPSVALALVSRAVSGVAASLAAIGGMIYTTEIVHPKVRDRIGSVSGILANLGMLIAFMSGSVVEWRGMAWIGVALSLPFFFILMYLQESPNYLIKKGRRDEARQVLLNYRESATEAIKEYEELLQATNKASKSTASPKDLFSAPYITPLLTCLILQIAQQLTGITGITNKAVTIFSMLGTSIDPAYCTVMIAIVSMITAVLTSEINARFERKPTLLVSTVFMAMAQVCVGFFLLAKSSGGPLGEWADANSILALGSVLFFYIAFGAGLGPMPWIYMGEGIPSKIRGPASAISMTLSMLSIFVVLQLFDPLIEYFGFHYCLMILAVASSSATFLALSIMLETKGKTVSQIDKHYLDLEKKRN
ncbi:facilitated trehalose transporter Tret1 [Hyalella azteca]|uniref:Facilitated trehalose transporter Tret1 n=1 Tax=Hyalella azteca TaxID=294128 RepID=A0A8B7N1L3_HYAAZ|nr:facilitated trehalose transporter Tret1 [Hyalella azteca]